MAELQQRSEIAFVDVEVMPKRQGQGSLLEFGAILVCPKTLDELDNYSTLIFNPSFINSKYDPRNGITRAAISAAPPFSLVADKIFDLLDGRIWAGHNILRFDRHRIREAFAEIDRSPPQPKWIIDSLDLLTKSFGRRAGDMKMASLATYFKMSSQTHRSLDDARMNLEVLKYCSTVLFLESSLPDIVASDTLMSPICTVGTHSGGRVMPMETSYTPNTDPRPENHSNQNLEDSVEPNRPETGPFNMGRLSEDVEEFLTPDGVNITSITASGIPFYGSDKIQILHDYAILKLHCTNLKVRFGIRLKFFDQAGRPKLNFVVDAPPSICQVLDACDNHAKRLFMESGSTSDWRPAVVVRNNGYWNFPTIRLHIPTVVTGNVAKYGTEIFQKEASSGAEQKLFFSEFDAAELESYFPAGGFVDAFFSLDTYDYQQNAGIRLMSEKLIIHSN